MIERNNIKINLRSKYKNTKNKEIIKNKILKNIKTNHKITKQFMIKLIYFINLPFHSFPYELALFQISWVKSQRIVLSANPFFYYILQISGPFLDDLALFQMSWLNGNVLAIVKLIPLLLFNY